jgi:hypothetical protein
MIVVGLDVHKHSLTAVAVDELGRAIAEHAGPVDELVVEWADSLDRERLWALEDCRHVTRTLERALLAAGERLVRVPPRLTAPQRRRNRTRGKSDAIDALAVARAALQEPNLDSPSLGEEPLRELKLLVDHRDDLVDERRRAQQRLRLARTRPDAARAAWRTRPHRLARSARPAARPPRPIDAGPDRATSSAAAGRSHARSSRSIANCNSGPLRSPRRCSSSPAADRSAQRSCCVRSARSVASGRTRSSPVTPVSRRSTRAQASTSATDSTAAATANSTAHCTGSRSRNDACTDQHAATSNANKPRARAAAKPSAASNDNSPAPSTPPSAANPH